MSELQQRIDDAKRSWQDYCRKLEETGVSALENMVEPSELALAEGLRYLTRISVLALQTEMEDCDSHKPHALRSVGPTMKMAGDCPRGHYLKVPVNPTDTFRLTGSRGNASWLSFQVMRDERCFADGCTSPFAGYLFGNELKTDDEGNFEIIVGPDASGDNAIVTDQYSKSIAIRQFFGTLEGVIPMSLSVENLSRASAPKRPLTVDGAIARLEGSGNMFATMVPRFQDVVRGFKEDGYNTMPPKDWKKMGGGPGGNPIDGLWQLAEDEALIISFRPPEEAAYWDIQVGNIWYETFDYRHFNCGFTCESAFINDDGSVSFIVSERDPGTVNWLQTAGHTEGTIAVRFQLIEGAPPSPNFEVVKHDQLASRIGHLPSVSTAERAAERSLMASEVDARYRL